MNTPIKVAVRVRPLLYHHRTHDIVCLNTSPLSRQIAVGDGIMYNFDHVLPMDCTQSQVYNVTIANLISNVIEGYNMSVITYGQTASGKTYTLFGPGLHCAISEDKHGIIPRTTRELFHQIDEHPERNIIVKVMFLEVHEDVVYDLLNPSHLQCGISITEDDYGSVIINGAEETVCKTVSEVFNCIGIGMNNRHLSVSPASRTSSHTLFILTFMQQWKKDIPWVQERTSKLIFVDLAGSERTFSSQGTNGWFPGVVRMDAGLSALANVVSALSDPSVDNQRTVIPYGESSLTKLLKDSFGGNSRTLFICCLSPASCNFDESLNSLRYAARVKKIINHPIVNMSIYMGDEVYSAYERYRLTLENKNDDFFGIKFAVQQWMALVSNAEGIFKKIASNECLPIEDKEKIQLWLCFKQEYDEYVAIDDTAVTEDNEHAQRQRPKQGCDNVSPLVQLEYTAQQWMKLVLHAEDLLKKIILMENLTLEEREEIQLWLCLKLECDECLDTDDPAVTEENEEMAQRSLGRIEELTENEDKTDDTGDVNENTKMMEDKNVSSIDSNQDFSQYVSDNESDLNSQTPDFLDKLDECMKSFKEQTDAFIWETIESIQFKDSKDQVSNSPLLDEGKDGKNLNETYSLSNESLNNMKLPLGTTQFNLLSSRRHSIHPGAVDAEMKNIAKALAKADLRESLPSHSGLMNGSDAGGSKNIPVPEKKDILPSLNSDISNKAVRVNSPCGRDLSGKKQPVNETQEAKKELNILAATKEAHQNQIRQILLDLQGAQRRIEELQNTIHIKEQFIADMIKNSETRASAKHRFERKIHKLEEEFYKAKVKLAQAEKTYGQATKGAMRLTSKEEEIKYKKEIDKFKKLACRYEQRLKDIENIKQLAGDSAKKVLELEHSLQSSRRQMEKLKKQLLKEEKNKQCLEQELMEDQKKIEDLEQKFAVQDALLSKQASAEAIEEDRLKWIQEEEERIVNMRESSKRFQEQLLQQQSMLEKRETFLKEKLALEKQKSKSQHKVSARILHLDDVMKEKSTHLERAANEDEKDSLRHEIQNLRRTRDCLTNQRYKLDEKYQKEKTLTSQEERKLLELDEALEAIDAAIEYKNELICGREDKLGLVKKTGVEEEDLLMARLMSLSPMETRTLLYKYFQRVIDLREGGRKMEIQIAELDSQTETQSWKIHTLNNALQQAYVEMDQRIVVMQKEHQERVHLLLRHFAEESSGGSGADSSAVWDLKNQLIKSKRENKQLRKRILEIESALQMSNGAHEGHSMHLENAVPQHNLLKRLQSPSAVNVPTTKVTRQRNKLIIQQQKPNRP